mgnify:CR=1 FL=1
MNFEAGDLVEVWDGDVRRWVTGTVEGLSTFPVRPGQVFVMVRADRPDPGPIAVEKVPSVYAIAAGDHGFIRRRRD